MQRLLKMKQSSSRIAHLPLCGAQRAERFNHPNSIAQGSLLRQGLLAELTRLSVFPQTDQQTGEPFARVGCMTWIIDPLSPGVSGDIILVGAAQVAQRSVDLAEMLPDREQARPISQLLINLQRLLPEIERLFLLALKMSHIP